MSTQAALAAGPTRGATPLSPPRTRASSSANSPPTVLYPIEAASRLSHSLIWQLQSSFYLCHGVGAWSESIVPNFVTTNRSIAAMYAKIVLGFVNDVTGGRYAQKWDQSQPIHIVELGAGHGKFSFLVLQALLEMQDFWPRRSDASDDDDRAPFVYVMSDFAEENIDFWSSHASFEPFVARGLVEFAVIDAEEPCGANGGIRLSSGRLLSAETNTNPIGLIANYVLDTLRHDAFRFVHVPASESRGGGAALQLQEALIEVASPLAYEPDLCDPELIKRFRHSWTYRDVPGAIVPIRNTAATSATSALPDLAYYSGRDAPLNAVLSSFAGRLACSPGAESGFSLLLPIGGLRCLDAFMRLSHGNLAFLVGDKAHTSVEELHGLRDPHLAIHGSFSMMVNLEAIRIWMEQSGLSGSAMHTPYLDGFKCSLFGRMKWAEEDREIRRLSRLASNTHFATLASTTSPSATLLRRLLRDCSLAFHSLLSFSPDQFSMLQRCIRDETPSPSLKHMLSLLRLSGCDSEIFYKWRQHLVEKVTGPAVASATGPDAVSEKVIKDMRSDLVRVAAGYYPLTAAKDVSFELGRLAMGLHDYVLADTFFQASLAECGDHHVTRYNLGLCANYESDYGAALEHFDRSIELYPNYTEAIEWRERVQARVMSHVTRAMSLSQPFPPSLPSVPSYSSSSSSSSSSSLPSVGSDAAASAVSTSSLASSLDLPFDGTANHMPFPSTNSSSNAKPNGTATTATAATGNKAAAGAVDVRSFFTALNMFADTASAIGTVVHTLKG